MAYFLATGDEEATPEKYKRLMEDRVRPQPIAARKSVRLEAENFRELEGCEVEDKNDRAASHRLNVKSTNGQTASIRTPLVEPYSAAQGRYDVEVRYRDEPGKACKLSLLIDGQARGAAWESSGKGEGWTTQTINDVEIRAGDVIGVQATGPARIDYMQLNAR
jgi:hypothetical protein